MHLGKYGTNLNWVRSKVEGLGLLQGSGDQVSRIIVGVSSNLTYKLTY